MSAPFKLIPTEKTYIAAIKHGLWKPQRGAPWGMINAKRGRPSGKSHERNVKRILRALRKHGPMSSWDIADAAGMAESTARKALTQMVKDKQVTWTVVTEKTRGNRTYNRRVYEVNDGSV